MNCRSVLERRGNSNLKKKLKKEKEDKAEKIIYFYDSGLLSWLRYFPKADLMIILIVTILTVGAYFYVLTMNLFATIILSLIPTIFVFYIIAENKKIELYRNALTSCFRYVNDMVFKINGNNNIAQSYEEVYATADDVVKEDLAITLKELDKTGILITNHFKKYDLPSLNQFHDSLQIVYRDGTRETEKVFNPIKDFMLSELSKQNKLHNTRTMFARSYYLMVFLSVLSPLILRFQTLSVYMEFLENQLTSSIIYFVYELIVIGSLFLVQRMRSDISVKIK